MKIKAVKMYKLYKIENKINKHTYIGMTKQTLEKRFSQHKNSAMNLNKKTILYDAMRKYGVINFEIVLLSEFLNKEDCQKAEISLIKTNGYYNLSKGGEGGFQVIDIEKWKLKLCKARKNRKPSLNMKHSEKNKKLFSEVSKNYWKNQETYDWEKIKKYNHKEAKEKFGISTTHYYRLKNGSKLTTLSEYK